MAVANGILTFGSGTTGTITIDHTQVGGTDSSNFTVGVSVTNAKFATVANGGLVKFSGSGIPFDLIFASNAVATTLLSWEIQYWNATTGQIVAWVKLATISHTVDTVFYVNVGGPYTSFQGGATGAAWSNPDYRVVQHLEDVAALNDSSGNGNTFTNNGTTNTAGLLHNGSAFVKASSQYQDAGTNPANYQPNPITVECWINASVSFALYTAVLTCDFDGAQFVWNIFVKSSGKLAIYCQDDFSAPIFYDGTGANTLSLGTWYHLAITYAAGSNLVSYVNGSVDATVTGTANPIKNDAGYTFLVGNDAIPGRFYNGVMNEVRISAAQRSADYLLATYNNLKPSSTFLTLVI